MILAKISLTCFVIVFAMKVLNTVYIDLEHKEPPDWFKVIGGLVVIVGFVSFIAAVSIAIWTL